MIKLPFNISCFRKNVILSLESFSRNEEDIFNNDNNADEVDFDH